ncbi:hypothetical protein Hte_009196 [Hypoxylon texense]
MQYGAFRKTAMYMKLKAAIITNTEAMDSNTAVVDHAAAVHSPAITSSLLGGRLPVTTGSMIEKLKKPIH